jgi:hypothetical protein
MSLFPNEDILTKEIESWKGFVDRLPAEEDRKTFTKMLNDCYKYAKAITGSLEPLPLEAFVLEEENEFAKFDQPSRSFVQFAALIVLRSIALYSS